MDWYYAIGGEQHGPVTGQQLKRLAGESELSPTDLVWHQGMTEWKPASSVAGLFPANTSRVSMSPPSRRSPESREENPYRVTDAASKRPSLPLQDLRRERPIGVVLTALYAAVGCLQSLFSHYFTMFLMAIAASVVGKTDEGIGVVIAMQIVSVSHFVFAILNATICYGLFTLQRWAHRITVVGYAITASLRLLALFLLVPVAVAGDDAEDIPMYLLMTLPSLVFEVIILIYFFQPSVKDHFRPNANSR